MIVRKMAGNLCLPVTVRDGNKCFIIDVMLNWNIAQVKKALATTGMEALQHPYHLVFAGTALNDDVTLEDAGIQSTTTIHCIRTAVQTQKLIRTKPLLSDVSLGYAEPTSLDSKGKRKTFYVFCEEPCRGVTAGKLRVFCSKCHDTSFVLDQAPCNWKDVLTPQQMHGHCNNVECEGTNAEFYFKCAGSHKTYDHDTSLPLYMFRFNNVQVECAICLSECNVIAVFDCDMSHSICLSCFLNYAIDALNHRKFKWHPDHGYTIQCPYGCEGSEVKDTYHFKILGKKSYIQYQRFAAEEYLRKIGGIYCPSHSCGAGFVPEDGQQKVECVECKFVFCRHCRNAYHSGSCSDPIQKNQQNASPKLTATTIKHIRWDEASEKYIRQTTKACPRCGINIEKTGGSNHMFCFICKFEFCWVCVIQWNGNCQGNHWFH